MARQPYVNPYARGTKGKRADLANQFFRSTWEANFARVLNLLISRGVVSSWEYEAKTFMFPVQRGNKQYTPDFLVYFPDGSYAWFEIKGWMDKDSKIKLKRMKIHFPDEPLFVVDTKWYTRLKKEYRQEIGELWEGK